jgi:hypothetical protein
MRTRNLLLYFLALPIFISFKDGGIPVFDRGPFGTNDDVYSATFSIGIFSLIYFSFVSIFKKNNNPLALLMISLLIGIVGYFTSGRPQAILVFQFFILLIIIPRILKNYNYNEIKDLCLNISFLLLIFQISALLNGLMGYYSAIIPKIILIYNYEQYFSYSLLIGLYFVTYFGKSKLYTFLYYLIAHAGAVDAQNASATFLLIIFPMIRLLQTIFINKKVGLNIRFLTIFLSMVSVVGLPFCVLIINVLLPDLYDDEMIGGRGNSYSQHFSDFNFMFLIIPKMIYVQNLRDPHNTYLTFGVTLGYIAAILLMALIVKYVSSLNFHHILFVAPFFAITFALTEPLQHQYTAGLFALFLSVLLRLSSMRNSQGLTFLNKSLKNERFST